jgi:hypothetical protein
MPKNLQANVPERGRLARQRGDALKSVESEINIEFNLNAFFALSRSCGRAVRAPTQSLDFFHCPKKLISL